MKKFFSAAALLLGVSFLFSSCHKDNDGDDASKLIGTWDCISTVYDDADKAPEGNVGDYIVLTATTLTFYYGDDPDLSDHGKPYGYSFDGSHISVNGEHIIDVTSFKGDTMVWHFIPMKGSKTYKKRK